MKLKKTILGLAVVVVAGVNAFNAVSGGQSKLSDLQMENIERLAEAEAFYDCDGNPEALCFHGSFPGVAKQGYITSAGL